MLWFSVWEVVCDLACDYAAGALVLFGVCVLFRVWESCVLECVAGGAHEQFGVCTP